MSWNIHGLINYDESLQVTILDWLEQTKNRSILDISYTWQELDQEVQWVEALITHILNIYCKKLRVIPFSKRWRNKKVVESRKTWAKEKKLWSEVLPNGENLKRARNMFYHTIQKRKKEYWQNFLSGEEELQEKNPAKIYSEDKNNVGKYYNTPNQGQIPLL